MGTGVGRGDGRAMQAAHLAISSPLLEESSIGGARAVLMNVTGGDDMGLHEVDDAASVIRSAAHEDADFIFGAVSDETLVDELRVTVIATGLHQRQAEPQGLAGEPQADDVHDAGPQPDRRRWQRAGGSPAAPDGKGAASDVPAYVRRRPR